LRASASEREWVSVSVSERREQQASLAYPCVAASVAARLVPEERLAA
jgi:hypothetical protein